MSKITFSKALFYAKYIQAQTGANMVVHWPYLVPGIEVK
jgi:hypothetical protein